MLSKVMNSTAFILARSRLLYVEIRWGRVCLGYSLHPKTVRVTATKWWVKVSDVVLPGYSGEAKLICVYDGLPFCQRRVELRGLPGGNGREVTEVLDVSWYYLVRDENILILWFLFSRRCQWVQDSSGKFNISPARRTDRTCLFSAWNRVNWCDKVASCLAAPHPYRWGSPINGQVFPSPFPRPVEVLSFDALCGFAAATRSWRMWVEPDGLSRQPNRRLRTLVDVQDVDAMDLWL